MTTAELLHNLEHAHLDCSSSSSLGAYLTEASEDEEFGAALGEHEDGRLSLDDRLRKYQEQHRHDKALISELEARLERANAAIECERHHTMVVKAIADRKLEERGDEIRMLNDLVEKAWEESRKATEAKETAEDCLAAYTSQVESVCAPKGQDAGAAAGST